MWPTIAATPAAAGSAGPGLRRSASQTLAAPLVMSSTATSTPAVTPDARITFAAPRFPLPTRRKSDAPQRRARISANGIDPIRYAAMMAMAMASRGRSDPKQSGLKRSGLKAGPYVLGAKPRHYVLLAQPR